MPENNNNNNIIISILGQDLFIYDKCIATTARRVTLAACEDHMLQIEDLGSNRYRVKKEYFHNISFCVYGKEYSKL